jgi:hypothetical protein
MAGQIHKGDIGTVLRIQVTENGVPFNASAATVTDLKLKKPSGRASLPRHADFETNGTDGVFRYVTQAGDLDESGPWQGQLYLEAPNGAWHTEMFSFQVGDTITVEIAL